MQISRVGLISGPVTFLLLYFFFKPEGLSAEGAALLAVTSWIAIWWITEAIPIAGTALLPLILFPLLGILEIKSTSTSYADPMVLLYMGGFMIALAIEKIGLHKRIALHIIALVGTDLSRIVLGFMLATAFLSMWISNTASSLMMLPIAIAVVQQLAQSNGDQTNENTLGRLLMLSIAYSASIGGMGTIIGTPTNIILVGVIKNTYGVEISFAKWMSIGLPISILLIGICWFYLVKLAFPVHSIGGMTGGENEIKEQLKALGKMSAGEARVLAVFVFVSFSWITRSLLIQPYVPAINDTIIALIGVLVLFIIPQYRGSKKKLLDWEAAEEIPWGILILFGGGLALAAGFQHTGLASWVGEQFTLLQNVPFWIFLLLIIAAVNFLTEITSNVATASMLLPILSAVALAMGVHPFGLMVGATLAASCAFMLPVATPPNAVVFGSGYLTIPAMMRTGIAMNLLSILLVTLIVFFLLPLVWGINLLEHSAF
ncbi:SLC13 family permease [Pleomorphovibrio marinus]|uniref:SLC13 family permease n=1 Tax=Pleomorphovibrio marinus TaxID=2164132 RepID=UPI000E0B97E4|nr:DASS family sodium-coupled anion symporter [Pleomorphovibrio marinus]